LSCADHPGGNPHDAEAYLGNIRGWGRPGEPLSVSQAAGWAEESGKAWGTIFNHALRGWTDFFATDDILPVPASVPEFTTYLEGKVDGTMLRASGTARWHVHMSSAGLLNPITTTCSDCILGITTTSSVTLTNSYTPNLEQIPPVLDTHAAISLFPSTFSDVSLSRVVSRESNYLGLLTLAWTYVLSAYWSEVQQGVLRYTDCKAPCCPSTTTASITHPCDILLTLDASEAASAEVEWWRAILAPGKGWEASIDRHGRPWSSPWSLDHGNGDTLFVIIWQDRMESRNEAPNYRDSLRMLRRFASSRGILRQASMAFIAALIVPTHNLWSIPIQLPPVFPRFIWQGRQVSEVDINNFDQLVYLLPRLITVSLFGVEGVIRSAFYNDTIHSLSSGQWIQPAVISWPDSSLFATEVGCQRCPSLAKWWIGMGISGLLSKKAIGMLVGTGMWPTNLVVCSWTGAKESYFCSVLERDISLTVTGNGPYRTIPRAEELLILFLMSGRGPEGRLKDATSCPWRPPGDVLFEMSSNNVILVGNMGVSGRLIYNAWEWGEHSAAELPRGKPCADLSSMDEMAERSGTATRAVLGWLEDIRGPDADLNVELRALQLQIQVVEDDSHVGGSTRYSDSFSNVDRLILPENPQRLLGALGRKKFADADLIDPWSGTIGASAVGESESEMGSVGLYGWCGLEAINAGLAELELTPISNSDALHTLSRTESDVEYEGMSINELECLLNTRARSIALVDCHSGDRWILSQAKYRTSIVNVGMDSVTHFIAISQE
jgi:hypothetical protein